MKEQINAYIELLDEISQRVDNSVEAAAVLLEICKDRRMASIQAENGQKTNLPTDKQLKYLKRLGVEFSDGLTKKEASELIEENK